MKHTIEVDEIKSVKTYSPLLGVEMFTYYFSIDTRREISSEDYDRIKDMINEEFEKLGVSI